MIHLAVIILNYRRADLVVDCLASLAPDLRGRPYWCAAVVDNASGDGSAERIEAAIHERGWGDWARVVRSPLNGGFSAGNNVGLRAVEAAHYVLLNSDTLVRPGAFAELLEAAERHPEAGLIGPRLEGLDGAAQESCFRFATPASELMAAAATGPISRMLKRYEVAMRVSETPLEPEWISFACVLLRGRALAEIGPLDEHYFMYFEDMDYCRRAWEKGWHVRYEPAAHVVHLRGGSSPVKSAFASRARVPRYYFASRTRYFAKHFGGIGGVLLANAAWLAGRMISKLRETLGSKAPHTAERQARDIWTDWRRPLAPPERPVS